MKKVKVVLRYGLDTVINAEIEVTADRVADGHSVVQLKNLLEGNAKVMTVKHDEKEWRF
jgi:hypothetical protein